MPEQTETKEKEIKTTLPYYMLIYRMDSNKDWLLIASDRDEDKIQKMAKTIVNAREVKILEIQLPI